MRCGPMTSIFGGTKFHADFFLRLNLLGRGKMNWKGIVLEAVAHQAQPLCLVWKRDRHHHPVGERDRQKFAGARLGKAYGYSSAGLGLPMSRTSSAVPLLLPPPEAGVFAVFDDRLPGFVFCMEFVIAPGCPRHKARPPEEETPAPIGVPMRRLLLSARKLMPLAIFVLP